MQNYSIGVKWSKWPKRGRRMMCTCIRYQCSEGLVNQNHVWPKETTLGLCYRYDLHVTRYVMSVYRAFHQVPCHLRPRFILLVFLLASFGGFWSTSCFSPTTIEAAVSGFFFLYYALKIWSSPDIFFFWQRIAIGKISATWWCNLT